MATPIGLSGGINTGLIDAAGRKLQTMFALDQDPNNPDYAALRDPFSANTSNYGTGNITAVASPTPPPDLKQFNFNPKYAGLDASNQRAISDAGLKRTNAISAANQNYTAAVGDADTLQQQALRKLTETLGSSGLTHSSIMLNMSGDQQQAYQRYLNNLGTMRGNALAAAEGGYATDLENVNRNREGLFFQQGQEEEAAARQRAKEEADAAAAAEQVRLQQQYNQAMIEAAQRQAAAAEEAARNIPTPLAPTATPIGAPYTQYGPGMGSFGLVDPTTGQYDLRGVAAIQQDPSGYNGAIAGVNDIMLLNKLYDNPLIPDFVKGAIGDRIRQLNAASATPLIRRGRAN